MGTCTSSKTQKLAITPKLSVCEPPRIRWLQGQLLGRGAYGKVYECLNLNNGQIHAVKHIELQGEPAQIAKEVENLRTEISMLMTLSHKNIIKYLQTEVSPDMSSVYIVLEYISGGSIRDLLNRFIVFDEHLVKIYTKQLLKGLAFLHSKRILHRDIKGANILVSQDGTLKLSDFGACKRMSSAQLDEDLVISRSLRGSPYWMAPEIAKRTGHSFSADVWSVGCTVIEMLVGKPPWSDRSSSSREVLEIIRNTESPPRIPPEISESCADFLGKCLRVDPCERPTAKELIKCAFLTDHLDRGRSMDPTGFTNIPVSDCGEPSLIN